MRNEKILIIANTKDYTVDLVDESLVDLIYVYNPNANKIKKIFRKLWHMIHIPYFEIWYEFKNMNISMYSLIILYECSYPLDVIKYIRKKNKNCKIIYWLWNPVNKQRNSILYKGINDIKTLLLLKDKSEYRCEIYSFDKGDCKKYDILYNNQVAYRMNIPLFNNTFKQDVFFCGQDKNRSTILQNLATILSKNNITWKIILCSSSSTDDRFEYITKLIPYEENIKNIVQSKCIVDLVQDMQNGLTWRPLEAMYYKKKLITNFTDIVKYDFYKKENIFVLGVDNINKIEEFINSPYSDIDDKIVHKYTFKGWLERLYNNVL